VCSNACSAAPPSCTASTRVYTSECGDWHLDETACNGAWQWDDAGATSCFYGVNRYNELGCWTCDPDNDRQTFCSNVCAAP
jgi:hypothetical protein